MSEGGQLGLLRHRAMRCLLAALFTAGVLLPVALVLGWVLPGHAAYLFIGALVIGFGGAQIHERLVRQAQAGNAS